MHSLPQLLGANICALRLQKNLLQDGLALLCGLDRSYMGRIERGEVNITVETLYQIAEALGCEPAPVLPLKNEVISSKS
ncbi:helix-turn-helix domain-containing protein [Nitrincola sp. MINF-07-Sa-05]|uniref:helix-turn-helix domain-containing protein n=1 Tax=Nitrincola salilacus TaxID=3400273 RepID=UPI003918122B